MMPEKIVVAIRNSFLIVTYKIMSTKIESVILPISATEGIIAALGRGARDTVTLKMINGNHYILD